MNYIYILLRISLNITHLGGCVAGDYCLPVPNDEAALVLVHAEHLRFESFVEIRTNIYTHLLHQQSSHGCSQTCNRYEICGRLHSSSEELKRQAEFLSVIMQVCPRPDFPPIKQLTYRTYHLSSRGKSGRGHTCRMSERNSASLLSSSE